jgi:predicted DNA-binding transcriptional regulator YafY
MLRPATRLLAALELLHGSRRVSGAELAERLAVDRRTVRRYIAMLEELGVPIAAERGRDGAYMLAAGTKLPPMMFTGDEAVALSLGLLAARGLGLADAAPAAGSAQAKLERVMPPAARRRVRALRDTVALDLTRPAAPARSAALVALSAAALSGTRVRLAYRPAHGEEIERDFDPYGLAYRGGRWYVVGMCHLRRGLRSFRLDRVGAIEPSDARFARPPGFDALEHLTLSMATLPRAHTVEVLLETDPARARRELFAALGLLEEQPGGVLLRSQTDDLAWFARELSRLPFVFQIRKPAALRTEVTRHARQLLGCSR